MIFQHKEQCAEWELAGNKQREKDLFVFLVEQEQLPVVCFSLYM